MTPPNRPRLAPISSDLKLGIAGCGLAAASASFGLAMMIRGPSENFGASGNFTVFAQFAGKGASQPSGPSPNQQGFGDLDTEATASIPRKGDARSSSRTEALDIADIRIVSAFANRAVLMIGGRLETVRVGDHLGSLGEVLQITAAPSPNLVTTRGVIQAAERR